MRFLVAATSLDWLIQKSLESKKDESVLSIPLYGDFYSNLKKKSNPLDKDIGDFQKLHKIGLAE